MWYIWVITLLLQPGTPAETGPDPFRVGGLPPSHAYVSIEGDPATLDVWRTPMLADLMGVVGPVEPRGLIALRAGLGERLDQATSEGSRLMGVLHLVRGGEQIRIDLLDLGGSQRAVRTRATDHGNGRTGETRTMDHRAFTELGVQWWRIGWIPEYAEPGDRVAIRGGGSPAQPMLEPQTTRRIFRTALPVPKRDLETETFHIRVPMNFDPSREAGVVIWLSPSEDGRLPPAFEPALDGLGLIAVGIDRAGNTRPTIDRLQLTLDALETVRRRYRIDTERIYVSGFSGGAKIACMLAMAMPDTFAGVVAIGGLASYHEVPTGDRRLVWAPAIGRPTPPVLHRLRDRRIGVIAGDLDMHRPEVERRVRLLEGDGLAVQLISPDGQGHALPDASTFRDSLRWVDEPRRNAIESGAAEARRLLEAIPEGADASNPDLRAALIAVIRAGPWSEPAWRAAERLGYSRQDFVSPTRLTPAP